MDLDDIATRGIYRYLGLDVIVEARLPGEPSEDDPSGPQGADMVIVRHLDDDHHFFVDPEDLAPLDLDDDDQVPFEITRGEILTRRVEELGC